MGLHVILESCIITIRVPVYILWHYDNKVVTSGYQYILWETTQYIYNHLPSRDALITSDSQQGMSVHFLILSWGAMKMGNIVPSSRTKPTSLAFQASLLHYNTACNHATRTYLSMWLIAWEVSEDNYTHTIGLEGL